MPPLHGAQGQTRYNALHAALRRRHKHHKRSKRGCLTCRVRRKKCPEDFQNWPDGSSACSACYVRGQSCRMAAATSMSAALAATASKRINSAASPLGCGPAERNSAPSSHTAQPAFPDHPSATSESAPGIAALADAAAANATNASALVTPTSSDVVTTHPRMPMPNVHTQNTLNGPPAHDMRHGARDRLGLSFDTSADIDSATPANPLVPSNAAPWNMGNTLHRASSTGPAALNPSSWLDTFFDEFMNITGPALQLHSNTDSPLSAPSLSEAATLLTSPSSTDRGDSAMQRFTACNGIVQGEAGAAVSPRFHHISPLVPWSDPVIDYTVRSSDLDALLIKWCGIYETYLAAIVDVNVEANECPSLISQLLEETYSNILCKASMVACCLAYRDVILRELQREEAPSRFVRYLVSEKRRNHKGSEFRASLRDGNGISGDASSHEGTNIGPSESSHSTAQFAHAWLRFSLEGFRKERADMPLKPRLVTLLNIRNATICLSGAVESYQLAPLIHSELAALNVDTAYLESTESSGTLLAFMIQALTAAHITDGATVRGARTAIADTPSASHKSPRSSMSSVSSVLMHDLATSPHLKLRYVTCLSLSLLLCIRKVSELAVDIKRDASLSKNEVDARSREIERLIFTSQIDTTTNSSSGVARIRKYTLHEMWRQAVLIQLLQDVHSMGPNARRLRAALDQILRLAEVVSATEESVDESSSSNLSTLARPNPPFAVLHNHHHIDVWDMSMVWFLASTVAVSDHDRAICMKHLETIGCERAILDNINAVKIIWDAMDRTGRAHDWRDTLAEHKLTVSYTF